MAQENAIFAYNIAKGRVLSVLQLELEVLSNGPAFINFSSI